MINDDDTSSMQLGLRTEKSTSNPKGWKVFEKIPHNESAIIVLAGTNTDTSKKANGVVKMIQEDLEEENFNVYSVEYHFGNRNFRIDREAVLARYGQENYNLPFINHVKDGAQFYIPNYIQQIYEATLAPRLRDKHGNRAELSVAAQQLAQLKFVNHCQGTLVMMQLEHLMIKDMDNFGYSKEMQSSLLQQVNSIGIAPVSPVGKTQTTTIKFLSMADDVATSVYTPKINYINKRKQEHAEFIFGIKDNVLNTNISNRPFVMNMSFFMPSKTESIFAVNDMYPLEIQYDVDLDGIEHSFDSYTDTIDPLRNSQGNLLSKTFQKTLNWLVRHSLECKDRFMPLEHISKSPEFKEIIKSSTYNRHNLIDKELQIMRKRRQSSSR